MQLSYFKTRYTKVSAGQTLPYPAVLREIKEQAIANSKQRFDTQSILDAAHHVIIVGTDPDIASIKSEIIDPAGKITKDSLNTFLSRLKD